MKNTFLRTKLAIIAGVVGALIIGETARAQGTGFDWSFISGGGLLGGTVTVGQMTGFSDPIDAGSVSFSLGGWDTYSSGVTISTGTQTVLNINTSAGLTGFGWNFTSWGTLPVNFGGSPLNFTYTFNNHVSHSGHIGSNAVPDTSSTLWMLGVTLAVMGSVYRHRRPEKVKEQEIRN